MANEFIIKNGFHSKGDSQVTGSINVSNTVFGGGLLIDGNSVLSGSVTVHATAVGSPIINFENDGTNSPLARITGQSYGGGVNGGLDFLYHNGTSLTEGFRLRNGRIGIGTTNPSQKLEVEGNISASGYVSASNGFIGDGSQLTNLPAGSTPTLQQVTDEGATTTNDIQITGSLTVSGSLHAFTLDSDSVILGQDAGKHAASTAENNVIIGVSAGISASNDNNVLIGKQAGETVTGDGSDNVFIGNQAGQQGAGKEENVAIGGNALRGYASSDGSDRNVAIGYYAGRLLQNSNDNVAIGHNAGRGNGSGGTGALRNLFLGPFAGYNHFSGIEDNIYVGYYAGAFNQTGDRNIIIGSGSTANGNPSDQLRIGHANLHVISGSLSTGDVIFYNTASAPNFSGSFQGDGSGLTNIDPFPYTGDAVITGSLVVTGSIEMALPSASAFKSFGVPGYYKITIPYNADTIIFQDENFYLEYNDTITDQLEAKVTTDPSSGTVDFVYWNNNDDTYVTFEKNASDPEFDIDSTFTNWEKATLEIFSTEDPSYPTYHITFNSADNVSGSMVLQKFV